MLDEHVVVLFPAAIYAICVGLSIIKDHFGGFSSYCNVDAAGKEADWLRVIYVSVYPQTDIDCIFYTVNIYISIFIFSKY